MIDSDDHPSWCDRDRCTAALSFGRHLTTKRVGEHRSAPKLLTGALWRSEERPLRLPVLWITESYDTGDGVIVHLGPAMGGGEATLSVPVHAERVNQVLAAVFAGDYSALRAPEPDIDPGDA
ncbi:MULTISPECIES: hypothetical protein [unclassified Nonomuraea]|uniref:hypothetical protein n=1 Tax=unclassified Nonomuraea TaxID=2593643 RepID=UPI0035BFDD8E